MRKHLMEHLDALMQFKVHGELCINQNSAATAVQLSVQPKCDMIYSFISFIFLCLFVSGCIRICHYNPNNYTQVPTHRIQAYRINVTEREWKKRLDQMFSLCAHE